MLAYTFYETDNRVKRYAETLSKRGDEVEVFALRKENQIAFNVINGVKIFRIQKRIVNEKSKASYLVKIVRFFIFSSLFLIKSHIRAPYDIIHVHSVPDFEVYAAWFPKLMGAKIILDIHDIVPEFYMSKFGKNDYTFSYKLLFLIEKFSIGFADHVIISNDIWYEKLVSRSVKEEKCTTILNYPDPDIFNRHFREKNNGKFLLMYPGTLNNHQGLDIAIKAVKRIEQQVPNIEFQIYGEGGEKEDLKNLISQLNLEGKIFIHDHIPIQRIAAEMATADLGIVPKKASSFGNEAFSTKILEFMALGVPVITASTHVDQYYFDESIVKFFQPQSEKDLADSMLLLIQNHHIRKQLVKNAFKFIEKNNWDVKKHTYLNLIDSINNHYIS